MQHPPYYTAVKILKQKGQDKSRITAAELKFFRKPAKCTIFNQKKYYVILKELNTQPLVAQISNSNNRWIEHVSKMVRSRLTKAVMKYQPAGKMGPEFLLKEASGL
jgi:hypothetical protein